MPHEVSLVFYDEVQTMTTEDWTAIFHAFKIGGRWYFRVPHDEREWLFYQHDEPAPITISEKIQSMDDFLPIGDYIEAFKLNPRRV